MTLIEALRADWIRTHSLTQEEFENLSQQHPDERMMRCPSELFNLPEEVEYRYGNGYMLPDGAWYDPVMETFHYFETVYEPSGEIRFDLGTDYQY